jgi:hypothetical protein
VSREEVSDHIKRQGPTFAFRATVGQTSPAFESEGWRGMGTRTPTVLLPPALTLVDSLCRCELIRIRWTGAERAWTVAPANDDLFRTRSHAADFRVVLKSGAALSAGARNQAWRGNRCGLVV